MNQPRFEITTSRGFAEWLVDEQLSLAFTTYQAGKLFFIGTRCNPELQLAVFERTFKRCLGLCGDQQTLWMSSLFQLWRFENVLAQGQLAGGADRLFVPQVGNTTGDLDVHDIAVEAGGRVVFVNTRFSCLATLSETHSFVPTWQPEFISELVPEDRCHLNGLAVVDGESKYVTAVSRSNVAEGWREHRDEGGIVIDVKSNEVVADRLSMPHSPRVYRDRLWLLNSGTGHFGFVDQTSGRFEEVTFCPGYLRGLSFHGDYAIVGVSKPRDQSFAGLQLDQQLHARETEAVCGIQVIDLRSGAQAHWLQMEGVVTELYDVVTLAGVTRPQAIGLKSDEIARIVRVDDSNH